MKLRPNNSDDKKLIKTLYLAIAQTNIEGSNRMSRVS